LEDNIGIIIILLLRVEKDFLDVKSTKGNDKLDYIYVKDLDLLWIS
jgi:hypothetical protein